MALMLTFEKTWIFREMGKPGVLVTCACYNKYHRWGGLKNRHLSFHSWKLEV